MIQLSLPSTAPVPSDKRRHTRVEREFVVRYKSPRADEWKTTKSGNVSVGGLFILGAEPPKVGSQIVVELLLDDQVFMKGSGVVRSQRAGDPTGFGVQFDSMDDTTTARILSIVQSHVTGQSQKVARPDAPRKRARRSSAWMMWVPAIVIVAAALGVGWWLIHLH